MNSDEINRNNEIGFNPEDYYKWERLWGQKDIIDLETGFAKESFITITTQEDNTPRCITLSEDMNKRVLVDYIELVLGLFTHFTVTKRGNHIVYWDEKLSCMNRFREYDFTIKSASMVVLEDTLMHSYVLDVLRVFEIPYSTTKEEVSYKPLPVLSPLTYLPNKINKSI